MGVRNDAAIVHDAAALPAGTVQKAAAVMGGVDGATRVGQEVDGGAKGKDTEKRGCGGGREVHLRPRHGAGGEKASEDRRNSIINNANPQSRKLTYSS